MTGYSSPNTFGVQELGDLLEDDRLPLGIHEVCLRDPPAPLHDAQNPGQLVVLLEVRLAPLVEGALVHDSTGGLRVETGVQGEQDRVQLVERPAQKISLLLECGDLLVGDVSADAISGTAASHVLLLVVSVRMKSLSIY